MLEWCVLGNVPDVLIIPTPTPTAAEDIGSTGHDTEVLTQADRDLKQNLPHFLHREAYVSLNKAMMQISEQYL